MAMASNPLEIVQPQPTSKAAKYDGRSTTTRHTRAERARRKITKENWEAARLRIPQLIASKDERIALETCKWIIEQTIGRAPVRGEISGDKRKPDEDNRLMVAIQSLIVNPPAAPAQRDVTMLRPTLDGHVTSGNNVTEDVTSDPSRREDPPVE